jgi:hypothetical protein
MLKTSVKNSAKVRKALEKELKKFSSDKSVLVGIRGDAGQHDEAGISLAQLGAIHEFGNDRVDERSFLRTGVEDARVDMIGIASSRLAKDGADKTLGLIGITAQNAVQNKIVSLRTPGNAESTKRAKGSSNPLVDTGQLLGSITFVVTDEKTEEGL